jgi:hypothetical protein
MFAALLTLTFASGFASGGTSSKEPSVLFAGGANKKGGAMATAEVFEPNQGPKGSFVAVRRMGTARADHTATLLKNGRVLIAGGSSKAFGQGNVFKTAELYNPSMKRFSQTGSMHAARTLHTATLLDSGKVLIAGGDDGTTSLTASELYDPTSAKFVATGAMSIGRTDCAATLLGNGQVLIAGGFQLLPDFSGSVLATAEIYDPATGLFSLTGTMMSARQGPTSTLLPNGEVLIAGGVDNDGNVLDTAELYDPTTGQFNLAGQMTTSRYGHLAALLGDGDVLIAGGVDNAGSSLSSAELYDATEGTFLTVASMPHDRFRVGATALSGNDILVAGGYTQCPSSALSFCEKPVSSALIFNHASNTFHSIPAMTSARGSFASTPLR